MKYNWITWELAQDKYRVSWQTLDILAIHHSEVCNNATCMVIDFWKQHNKDKCYICIEETKKRQERYEI